MQPTKKRGKTTPKRELYVHEKERGKNERRIYREKNGFQKRKIVERKTKSLREYKQERYKKLNNKLPP